MFTDFSLLTAQSDLHRKELLADADNYRLARLASALRRRKPRGGPPPQPVRDEWSPPVRPVPADRNVDAERRYAVPR